MRPRPLRRAGLCRRATLRHSPCICSAGCLPPLQAKPQGLLPAPLDAHRESSRPCRRLVQPLGGPPTRHFVFVGPGQAGPFLAPLKAPGGPRKDLCGLIREGGSGERSECTSHDGRPLAGVRCASRSRCGRMAAATSIGAETSYSQWHSCHRSMDPWQQM